MPPSTEPQLQPGPALELREPALPGLTNPDHAWKQVELTEQDCRGAVRYASRRICGHAHRLFLSHRGPIYAQLVPEAP